MAVWMNSNAALWRDLSIHGELLGSSIQLFSCAVTIVERITGRVTERVGALAGVIFSSIDCLSWPAMITEAVKICTDLPCCLRQRQWGDFLVLIIKISYRSLMIFMNMGSLAISASRTIGYTAWVSSYYAFVPKMIVFCVASAVFLDLHRVVYRSRLAKRFFFFSLESEKRVEVIHQQVLTAGSALGVQATVGLSYFGYQALQKKGGERASIAEKRRDLLLISQYFQRAYQATLRAIAAKTFSYFIMTWGKTRPGSVNEAVTDFVLRFLRCIKAQKKSESEQMLINQL